MEERKQIKNKVEWAKSTRLQQQLRQKYRVKDKEVKSSIRADKRAWLENQMDMAQKAASQGSMKTLYETINGICNIW